MLSFFFCFLFCCARFEDIFIFYDKIMWVEELHEFKWSFEQII